MYRTVQYALSYVYYDVIFFGMDSVQCIKERPLVIIMRRCERTGALCIPPSYKSIIYASNIYYSIYYFFSLPVQRVYIL